MRALVWKDRLYRQEALRQGVESARCVDERVPLRGNIRARGLDTGDMGSTGPANDEGGVCLA